jgi:primosomal protein N' (replication factor Y) (superfamily II helicase)
LFPAPYFHAMIIQVVLDVPLNRAFDYRCDDATQADIGRRVLVPFGKRKLIGMIIGVAQASVIDHTKLKRATEILRDIAPCSTEEIALFQFCSQYYLHPLGEVMLNALPPLLRRPKPIAPPAPTHYTLTAAGRAEAEAAIPARARVARELLQLLQNSSAVSVETLRALSPSAMKHLKSFIQQAWAEPVKFSVQNIARHNSAHLPRLNNEQAQVVEKVSADTNKFQVTLLHGITGSGKTEIYLRLIADAIARGGQALVLVPEINLTPQLENTFRTRFPGVMIASLHSHLNDSERLHHWLAAKNGDARIIIGTRLAVFAPIPDLNLIVVDEEHDGSFKQQDGLRYSARDVAVFRASQRGIPIVLGSATPSLESWHNAHSGRYQFYQLNQRAIRDAALPTIHLIDMRRDKTQSGIGDALLRAIQIRLDKKQQSLLFINRRGYAPALMCHGCGWAAGCKRCSGKLVLHLRSKKLRCHLCGSESRIPTACPDCGNLELRPAGHGTQRIETTLAERFPTARILRVDRDSTRNKHAMRDMLAQIHAGEADILVGTQMLAKGHDFPNLTLVGVVNADGALYSSDFRAGEKLFAQLMQVSGRAGRADLAGEVLVQTEIPDHPLYGALMRHDFTGYADTLMKERKSAGFPPYMYQTLLRFESVNANAVEDFAELAGKLARDVRAAHAGITVYDAVPAGIARIAGKERMHLLAQSASRAKLQRFSNAWHAAISEHKTKNVRWAIDVDPLDI